MNILDIKKTNSQWKSAEPTNDYLRKLVCEEKKHERR